MPVQEADQTRFLIRLARSLSTHHVAVGSKTACSLSATRIDSWEIQAKHRFSWERGHLARATSYQIAGGTPALPGMALTRLFLEPRASCPRGVLPNCGRDARAPRDTKTRGWFKNVFPGSAGVPPAICISHCGRHVGQYYHFLISLNFINVGSTRIRVTRTDRAASSAVLPALGPGPEPPQAPTLRPGETLRLESTGRAGSDSIYLF